MNDIFLYMVNFILVILLIISTAGSGLFTLLKLFADFFSGHYEIKYHYALMRAVVLFCLIPVLILAVVIVSTKNCVTWGILSPEYGLEIVGYQDFFGIMMISNQKLNVARVCIFCIWLAGFAVTFIYRLACEKHALKKIRKHSTVWHSEQVNRIRQKIMQETGTGRKIQIYQSSIIKAPFSAGIIHPKIYFPEINLDDNGLYNIVKHEYIHCQRSDMTFRLLMMLIRGIHWYHPFIWFFEREFFNYSELACDEAVLKNANADERYSYAQLVISMLETDHGEAHTEYGTNFVSKNENEMKRRILHIMRGKRKIAKAAILSGIIFFTALCPAATYAASQGVSAVNRHISKIAEEAVSTKEELKEFVEFTEHTAITGEELLKMQETPLMTGERANIDVTIAGNQRRNLQRASLKRGDTVTVRFMSDNINDSFVIGLMNADGDTRYVNSNIGTCAYTFKVNKTSDYVIFIEGRNSTNSSKIHVTGSIVMQ